MNRISVSLAIFAYVINGALGSVPETERTFRCAFGTPTLKCPVDGYILRWERASRTERIATCVKYVATAIDHECLDGEYNTELGLCEKSIVTEGVLLCPAGYSLFNGMCEGDFLTKHAAREILMKPNTVHHPHKFQIRRIAPDLLCPSHTAVNLEEGTCTLIETYEPIPMCIGRYVAAPGGYVCVSRYTIQPRWECEEEIELVNPESPAYRRVFPPQYEEIGVVTVARNSGSYVEVDERIDRITDRVDRIVRVENEALAEAADAPISKGRAGNSRSGEYRTRSGPATAGHVAGDEASFHRNTKVNAKDRLAPEALDATALSVRASPIDFFRLPIDDYETSEGVDYVPFEEAHLNMLDVDRAELENAGYLLPSSPQILPVRVQSPFTATVTAANAVLPSSLRAVNPAPGIVINASKKKVSK